MVGFGWFPTKETECEQTKTNQDSYVLFNQPCKLIPVGQAEDDMGGVASGEESLNWHFSHEEYKITHSHIR